MKKHLILLLAALAIPLSACSSADSSSAEKSTADTTSAVSQAESGSVSDDAQSTGYTVRLGVEEEYTIDDEETLKKIDD